MAEPAAPATPFSPPTRQPKDGESYVKILMDEAERRTPEPYKQYVKKVAPVLIAVGDGVDNAWPYVVKAYDAGHETWKKLEPYEPQQYLPLICGLGMAFFGGSFLLLIAAVEAVRATALPQLQSAVTALMTNGQRALEAKRKDDETQSGASVPKQQRLTHTFVIVMSSVNPDECGRAVSALWICFLSIVATLKLQFARCITLGSNLASMVYDAVHHRVDEQLASVMPPELRKWAPWIIKSTFGMIGFFCAWILARFVGGFHAAMRGGKILGHSAVILAKKRGFIADTMLVDGSKELAFLCTALGGFGFAWQVWRGFDLMFPFNLLFLPATLLEWALTIAINLVPV